MKHDPLLQGQTLPNVSTLHLRHQNQRDPLRQSHHWQNAVIASVAILTITYMDCLHTMIRISGKGKKKNFLIFVRTKSLMKVKLYFRSVLIAALLYATTTIQAQVISTVAGGKFGNGLPATSGLIASPRGMAVDTAGNIYFFTGYYYGNTLCRLQKIDHATGIMSTVSGNTTCGAAGDNGPAVDASITTPSSFNSIAIDTALNIYLVDEYNNRIRKITAATGIITTIAGNGTSGYSGDGGLATQAQLKSPKSIALDDSGNVYFSDQTSARIRKISAATGIITTVAGAGLGGQVINGIPATQSRFGDIRALALDAAGNIYLHDSQFSMIRIIDAATGIINTVPGAEYTYGAVFGLKVDKQGTIFFTNDFFSIYKISTTGVLTKIVGTDAMAYNGENIPALQAAIDPRCLALDKEGNLLFGDYSNNRIRKFTAANNLITTVGGNGTPGFIGDNIPATESSLFGPDDIAIDSSGNIYIAEQFNARVRKVDAATGIITTIAGYGKEDVTPVVDGTPATSVAVRPVAVAVDAAQDIYVDANQCRCVCKIDHITGNITKFAGGGSYTGSATVSKDSALIKSPQSLLFDANGDLFVSEFQPDRIRKISVQAGTTQYIAGSEAFSGFSGDGADAAQSLLNFPQGIAFDNHQNIYIADWSNNRIRKIDRATNIITTFAGNGNGPFLSVFGVATSRLDTSIIYFTDDANKKIRKADLSTGQITTVAGNGAEGYTGDGGLAINATMQYPRGIKTDRYGDIYFVDFNYGCVRKITNPVVSVRNGNWSDPATWSNGKVPGTYTQVTVRHAVVVDINADAYSVTNEPGSSLTVSPGLSLTLSGR